MQECIQNKIQSFTFYKTQRSYKKIMCVFYFIGSVVKILCFYFLYIKGDRLQKN